MIAVSSVSAATVAYWEFDSNTGDSPASVGAAGTYDLSKVGTVSNSTLVAANPISTPDSTVGFVGNASANAGSHLSTPTTAGYHHTKGDATAALNLNSTAWTIEGWFLQGSSRTATEVLFNTRGNSGGLFFTVRDGNRFNLFGNETSGGTSMDLDFATTIAVDTWYHVALTYDSVATNEFQLFLDGSSVGVGGLGTLNAANLDSVDQDVLQFDARETLGSAFGIQNTLTGNMDEWRISNQVLAPSPCSAFGLLQRRR